MIGEAEVDKKEVLAKNCIYVLIKPKGHDAMDKALAWRTDGWGSNSDTTKVYSAPILLDTPTMWTLSLTMPVVMCCSVNTCHGGGKKRGIMVKF